MKIRGREEVWPLWDKYLGNARGTIPNTKLIQPPKLIQPVNELPRRGSPCVPLVTKVGWNFSFGTWGVGLRVEDDLLFVPEGGCWGLFVRCDLLLHVALFDGGRRWFPVNLDTVNP